MKRPRRLITSEADNGDAPCRSIILTFVNTEDHFDAGDAELPDDIEAIDLADLIARRVLRDPAGGAAIATTHPRHR